MLNIIFDFSAFLNNKTMFYSTSLFSYFLCSFVFFNFISLPFFHRHTVQKWKYEWKIIERPKGKKKSHKSKKILFKSEFVIKVHMLFFTVLFSPLALTLFPALLSLQIFTPTRYCLENCFQTFHSLETCYNVSGRKPTALLPPFAIR